MKEIFFLSGLPRAGNTLFGSLMNQNSKEPKIDFTMVLKVDIVEKNAPNERHTADPRRGINPKLSTQIVTEGGLTRDY